MTTLHSMLLEMGTWCRSTADQLERAEKSGITTKNNKDLKRLVADWQRGAYDEAPEYLHNELLRLLP